MKPGRTKCSNPKSFLLAALVAILVAGISAGQTRPVAFETVSVTPSTATPQQRQWLFGSWKVNIIGQPLIEIIQSAYQVKENRLIAPDWMRTATYDIAGTIPDNTQAQAPEMLRKVLEDKFQMRVHREMQPQPAYVLRVAQGGLKLTPVTDQKPATVDPITGATEITGTASTLGQLAVGVQDRTIVDDTGLKGLYRGALDGRTIQGFEAGGRAVSVSRAPSARDQTEDQKLAKLNETLEKLGLELRPGTTPVEFLIVDSAEKTPREK
jgi:uncharacterized protein (TIGR03435 family)